MSFSFFDCVKVFFKFSRFFLFAFSVSLSQKTFTSLDRKALEKSSAFLITESSVKIFRRATRFTAPPMPSTTPFPCIAAKKCQRILTLCFFSRTSSDAIMSLFLNCDVALSLWMWTKLTVSGSWSRIFSRFATTEVFVWSTFVSRAWECKIGCDSDSKVSIDPWWCWIASPHQKCKSSSAR